MLNEGGNQVTKISLRLMSYSFPNSASKYLYFYSKSTATVVEIHERQSRDDQICVLNNFAAPSDQGS